MSAEARVTRIDAVLRTVPDLAAAEAFYCNALGFIVGEPARRLCAEETALLGVGASMVTTSTLSLGRQSLALLQFEPAGRPYPEDSTSSDLWFQHCALVVSDMEAAFARLTSFPASPISRDGPQQLPPSTGGVRAYKFRDPYGHPLELLWFPPGSRPDAWQSDSTLIEGIDHTAIAVGTASTSSRFYQDRLGLSVGDRTRNRGRAQDKLDAIPADDVDVVPLLPAQAPPHLELLGYRVGTRRPLAAANPADAQIERTLASVDDLEAVASRLTDADDPRRGRWMGRDAVRFHDPDGHVWICVEN